MKRAYYTFNGRLLLILAAALLSAGAAAAQNVSRPDCIIDVTLTAAGQVAGGPGTCGNNINGVYEWRFNYKSTGFSVLSVIVQSAPDNGGVPGAWVPFAGTVTGSNPNTAITQGSSNFVGFYPWVRVLLTSATGTGTITGQLYGCREPGCSIAGAAINAVVTIPNPLPVDGPDAAGSPPAHPPVLVGGQDGAPGSVRVLKTDSAGEPIPANVVVAGADGISNTQQSPAGAGAVPLYYRDIPYLYMPGTNTNNRQFGCDFQAVAVLAPGTTGVLILGTPMNFSRICHIHMSATTNVTLVINSGTGSNCGTGTFQIDGYDSVPSFAMDFSPLAPLKAHAAGDDICYTFSPGNVTATFTVIYAQFP